MRFINTLIRWKDYFLKGVWRDPRNKFSVRLVKMLNLSMRSFMDQGLQSRSMALTYSTVLAIVPALALLVAIARGFGLQKLIDSEMLQLFPSQADAIHKVMGFVDAYLNEASQGVFVGVGLIVLIWTLVSLMSTVDGEFNRIWGVKITRSLYRQITDYLSICLIVPILMMCSAGISIFMSTIVHSKFGDTLLTPFLDVILDSLPVVLAWLAITFSYFLIPDTKVKFKYAAIAGGLAAIGFEIIQLLFVNGQIYVSKYNAIYGSFAFLPLLLVWLQLSWLILLCGCVLASSMQNVLAYNYFEGRQNVSPDFFRGLVVVVMAVIMKRHDSGKKPMSRTEICIAYNLPNSLVSCIIDMLRNLGFIYFVEEDGDRTTLAPAVDKETFTIGTLLEKTENYGDSNFIPYYCILFRNVIETLEPLSGYTQGDVGKILVNDLEIPTPKEAKGVVDNPDIPAFTT